MKVNTLVAHRLGDYYILKQESFEEYHVTLPECKAFGNDSDAINSALTHLKECGNTAVIIPLRDGVVVKYLDCHNFYNITRDTTKIVHDSTVAEAMFNFIIDEHDFMSTPRKEAA